MAQAFAMQRGLAVASAPRRPKSSMPLGAAAWHLMGLLMWGICNGVAQMPGGEKEASPYRPKLSAHRGQLSQHPELHKVCKAATHMPHQRQQSQSLREAHQEEA